MNLKFIPAGETQTVFIQKANVTNEKEFWRAWTYAKAQEAQAVSFNCDPPKDSLKSLITLRRETINNEPYWFAYRQVSKNTDTPNPYFPLSYSLRDASKLLPFQPKAVAHICSAVVSHGAAIDGSDTGIGKTYIALAAARDLKYRPAIICKKAGIAGWKKVCDFFKIDPLFIVNWEYAKSTKFPYATRTRHEYSGVYNFTWHIPGQTILIFDEAHSANNYGSQNSLLYIASKGIPSISCSATIADRPERLKPLFHLLNISHLKTFDSWLCSRKNYFINQYDKVEFLSNIEEMVRLNALIYPRYGYRLSYQDNAVKKHFPQAVYQTQIISLGQKAEHEQNELYKIMLQKANYFKTLGKQAEKMVAELRYRQATELLKCDAIAELTEDFLQQGHSVCIFVNYRETLAHLSKRFNTRSLIFGDQEKYHVDREQVIDDFQTGKTNIIIAMVDAGGQSISLHDLQGNHPRISLICPTYDSVKLKQVMGRTYRAGSKSTPIIKLVYAAGTIEEKVSESVNKKLANISALNDGDLMEEDLFKIG